MKALILGAGGQLGGALVKAALASAQVTALSRQDCDIVDADAVRRALEEIKPELVFNAAAYTAVDKAEAEREAAFAVNAQAPGVLAREAHRLGARLIHVSTDFVFSGEAAAPYAPDAETGPLSVYGASKLAGEAAVLGAHPNALVVRTAWLYAARGRNFLTTMLRLMREGKGVRVVSDQTGSPTSAGSLANGLWVLAGTQASGVLHYTDSGAASWHDFAQAIAEEAHELGLIPPVEVTPITTDDYPTAARRPKFSVLDSSETWRLIGEAAPPWRTNLRSVLKELANG